MADTSTASSLPGITALPPTTARQIGSGQVLVDTSSVVKELIDNALDARAKTIFVDITANTIDSIQVKDDGHGIPAEDRALVCRRYCTSKIRDLHDLKEVGGRWLGFRGEALSSMAELSGALSVTTRVEGEPVAVKLKYGRNGELVSTERDSHPVGTTVKAIQFFEIIPVRKQTAIKNAAKCLAKIRRLMQAYALARPAVRFRLHVLKAKNNKSDFMYTPKANSNFEDAVLKVISKDCALQCDWTALESDDFEIHAFLPKPTASAQKIANQGAFISIDSRPVSSTRGLMKQIVGAFKERLRRSNRSLATVKDPFFCMNILCPPESYDPNIEPAKDDVMFDDGELVLHAVDRLFKSYYPEAMQDSSLGKLPSSEQSQPDILGEGPVRTQTPISVHEYRQDSPNDQPMGDAVVEASSEQPRWRSSMYGIDEDDVEHLQENQPPVLEEEEGSRSAAVSNPWTIARMHAPVKPKTVMANGQLLSPAKSQGEEKVQPSSPVRLRTPAREVLTDLMTPQTSSRIGASRSVLDHELEQSIQHLSHPNQLDEPLEMIARGHRPTENIEQSTGIDHTDATSSRYAGQSPSSSRAPKGSSDRTLSHSLAPTTQNSQRKRRAQADSSSSIPADGPNDTWSGQPMRGSGPVQQAQREKRCKAPAVPLFMPSERRSPRKPIVEAERAVNEPLFSEHNTDIRTFFGQNVQQLDRSERLNPRASLAEPLSPSEHVRSLMPRSNDGTNSQSQEITEQLRAYAERDRPLSQPSSVGATSFDLPYRSHHVRDATRVHDHQGHGRSLPKTRSQFQPYEDVNARPPLQRSMSADSERPSIVPQRPSKVRSALDLYRVEQPSNSGRDMAAQFKAYQDREIGITKPIRSQDPRILPAHEAASKPRPERRRTTDGAQRTKSSKLPLERVPHGYHIQNLILPLQLRIAGIVYSTCKLDMGRNSLGWGYAAGDWYDAFTGPVAESRIMQWVTKLDNVLHERHERLPGVETAGMLHEAIQSGLDARKDEEETMDIVEIPAPATVMRGTGRVKDIVPSAPLGLGPPATKAKTETTDVDMSQFIDIDMDRIDDDEDSQSLTMDDAKPNEDFGQDIDDDMLMDL